MNTVEKLNKVKEVKNDEFYTMIDTIENELIHYRKYLKDKIIYCNCDSEKSNFYKYFYINFYILGIKKLIATCYNKEGNGYKIEVYNENNILKKIKTKLKGNGDFRSEECVEILKECDIVVTNPPFSLFREFINLLMKYNKKFLIIGPKLASGYKDIFEYIKAQKIWFGYTNTNVFIQPDGSKKNVGGTLWYVNLPVNKNQNKLKLYKKYIESDYYKYENYDAINIDSIYDIPIDYYGKMGVPNNFLEKWNSDEFELIEIGYGKNGDKLYYIKNDKKVYPFRRIIIKRKR